MCDEFKEPLCFKVSDWLCDITGLLMDVKSRIMDQMSFV